MASSAAASRARALALAALLGLGPGAAAAAAEDCVPVGGWRVPGGESLPAARLAARAAESAVVLLGENHDNAEHHRWQLQVLTALHARRPDMVIALEMFPRSVQPALDRWVAGELSVEQFLEAARWREVWAFDPELYLPLFHFARMNRLPMVGVNVDRALVDKVGERGLAEVPEAEREGVGAPAAPRQDYVDMLRGSWLAHLPEAEREAVGAGEAEGDPRWLRFLDVQLLWDRAMAEGMLSARAAREGALVVGILGSGHVAHGWGVGHQLGALGEARVLSLLPWDRGRDCATLTAGLADAVFGLEPPPPAPAPRPRLGVTMDAAAGGVRILGVEPGSVAEQAGLREGDVVIRVAGAVAAGPDDLAGAVQRQAPGTWLPLEVEREGERLELLAKFPPAGG